MSVGVLDHFNIRTRKLADTVRFYEDVLGLENGDRPNFAFPGAWMYSVYCSGFGFDRVDGW